MDDLESFFYILCWICCGYSAPGRKIEKFASTFVKWEHPAAREGADSKNSLYMKPFQRQKHLKVTDYFGNVFVTLLDSLHEFFQSYILFDRVRRCKPSPPTLDEAYSTILELVKKATASVETEEASEVPELPAPDDVPPATPEAGSRFSLMDPPRVYHTRSNSSKRTYDESTEVEERGALTKRPRPHAHAPHQPSALSSSSLAADEP